ncbi:hypothetical protein PG985_005861 [Apiospora marii]|uniref:uncharacterized protein n=1 Tax=Apiospora marii TaxID=335849 RepID=UPI00312F3172
MPQKRAYAVVTGASFDRLLGDRLYKEQHREALTTFYQSQVLEHPKFTEKHFLEVVRSNDDVDVLFVTGLRDEAPVTILAHLVPDCKLLDVDVRTAKEIQRARRGFRDRNATNGTDPEGAKYRCQKPDGLAICTNLLMSQFHGNWGEVDVVASCETGGFVFASALAVRAHLPLALIQQAGKLAPPLVSVRKSQSYISSLADHFLVSDREKRIEMDRHAVPEGASVVVVDDVLATGETLCTVLQLLGEAGLSPDKICILVVAELPNTMVGSS